MKHNQKPKVVIFHYSTILLIALDVAQWCLQTFNHYCPSSHTLMVLGWLYLLSTTPWEVPLVLLYCLQTTTLFLNPCLLHVTIPFNLQVAALLVFSSLLYTIQDWLLPSYGSQQLSTPKATKGYASLLSVLETCRTTSSKKHTICIISITLPSTLSNKKKMQQKIFESFNLFSFKSHPKYILFLHFSPMLPKF